jgi:hypothetical protein
MASLLEFTVPALRFVVDLAIKNLSEDAVSVIMFSDDEKFVKTVEEDFRVII